MPTPANSLNITQTGVVVFDGVSNFLGRTLTGGSGITVANGDGLSGNPTISLTSGGAAVEHLTGDTGGLLNPIANNFNLLGQQAGTIAVMDTIGSGATINFEDRTWTTALVVDASSTVGLRGTFTTITLAMAAAVSGNVIFVRPGTYTENITWKAGVDIVAYETEAITPNVTIVGKITATDAGSRTMSGIKLQTNSDFFLAVTGTNAVTVTLINCFFTCSNNTGISYTNSNASSNIFCQTCRGDITTTGITLYSNTSSGGMNLRYCSLSNSGNSTTASNNSAGAVNWYWCNNSIPVSTSSTAPIGIFSCLFDTDATNTTCAALNGSGQIQIKGTYFFSGSGTAVTVGGSASASLVGCMINSSNAAAISGAGTLSYADVAFIGSSSTITVTTQTPNLSLGSYPYRSVNNAASPYSTIDQDQFISVDCSAGAVTINLPNAPTSFRPYIIKDRTGSAATHNITVTTVGGAVNIDGATSQVISSNFGSLSVIFNGTSFEIY